RWLALGASASLELEHLGIDGAGLDPVRARRAGARAVVDATITPIEPLALFGVASLECDTTSGGGAGAGSPVCGALEPTARAGVRARVARGVELLGSFGRYARVPTLGELYGTSAVIRGNDTLVPERGLSGEAGARLAGRASSFAGSIELFGYARFASDL